MLLKSIENANGDQLIYTGQVMATGDSAFIAVPHNRSKPPKREADAPSLWLVLLAVLGLWFGKKGVEYVKGRGRSRIEWLRTKEI